MAKTGPKPRSEIDRFMDSCIPEPNSGCWIWIKALTGTGYGQFRVGSLSDGTRRNVTASRFACEMAFGPIPNEMQALHHCDNKTCVNPDHLYIGTRSQNARDAIDRGLKLPPDNAGVNNPRARLSEEDVRFIRMSSEKNAALARKFGLSDTHVGYIKQRKSWAHVD